VSAAAAKRTVLAAVSVTFFLAVSVAGPAGGAHSDRVRPKAPTNPHVTAATATSVTIAWGAAADNVAVVGYDVYLGSQRARVTRTSHALRKLACGSAFSVALAAVDAAGNRSPKISLIAATAACSDSTRPSAPTGFRQAATSGDAVVLTWQPSSDDGGVVAYGVYDELARISSSSESTATLTGLACGSTNVFSVDAVDAAGNRSARQQVYVETADCPTGQTMSVFSATAGPDWARCALEGEHCSFSGAAEVRYGANGNWTSSRSFSNGVACTNSVFGDPLYGVRKSCELRSSGSTPTPPPTPPTSQWAHCTTEGSTCSFSGSREVRYGANGTWTSPRTFTNGVSCTNHVFGDPLYGVVKSCHTRTPPTSPPPPPPPPPAPSPPPAPAADRTPPSKPVLSLGAIGRNTATLNWQPGTDNVGVDHYAVWLDGRLLTRTTGTSHTYTGLECDTQYVLGLQVVDVAGNTSLLAEALWGIRTTACSSTATSDRQSPTTPTGLAISSATQTSVRLGWNASTDNVGVTGYDVEKDGALATSVTAPGATIAGLACGTSYGFGVKAFDAAGNRSSAASLVGSTSPCSDTQAPTAPTNVTASSRTATSIALSWSAASDNTGVVGYGLYRAGVLTGTASSAPGIFSGLACNTNYTLAVDAYDASGNRSPRVTIAAGTTACPDTTPPSTPTGLVATSVAQDAVILTWSASTDSVGVAGYDVFRAGTKVATTTATTSSQSGLACGTTYGFSVQAFDGAGNRSAQASITVVTSACAALPPSGTTALAVSPTGNDATCVRGNLTRPCQTFDRAYQLASCGDVVTIRSGNYAEQVLRERPSCATPVTLNAEPGVVTQRVWFGTCQGCYSSDAPDDLVLRGLKTAGVIMWGDVEDVTLDRIDGGSFFIRGGVRVTVRGSDWGPCPSPASGSSANQCLGYYGPQQSRISYESTPSDTSNILVEGNVFHDHPAVSPDHWECLWTNGAKDVTFRGNIVRGCQNTGAFWLDPGSQTGLAGTWVFENNWFLDNGSAIGIGRLPLQNGRVIIRFNSFGPGAGILYHGSGSDTGTVRIVGNILGRANCFPGASVSHNVFMGQACGGQGNVSVGSLPYVNASGGSGADYRLAGAPGSTVADNLVPASVADAALGIDYDGAARSAPRDAGADDR
jgi:chitodextrinase